VLAGGVIKELAIYKRKSEKNAPFLMKQVTLFTAAEAAVATAPPTLAPYSSSSARPNGQSSAMGYTPNISAASAHIPARQRRLPPITLIAVFYFFMGGLGIVFSLIPIIGGLALGSAASSAGAGAEGAAIGGGIFLLGLFVMALGIGQIVAGVGLMQMKVWGLWAAYVVEALSLIGSIIRISQGGLLGISIMVLRLRIIWYLIDGDTRSRFD
jgi:hypothetical protein